MTSISTTIATVVVLASLLIYFALTCSAFVSVTYRRKCTLMFVLVNKKPEQL